MADHRSIQDIIPPARSKPIRPQVMNDEKPPAPPPPPIPPQPMRLKPEKSPKAKLLLIAAVVVVVAAIIVGAMSTVFHQAYVSVTPYVFSAKIQESIQAIPTSTATPYQKVSVTDTATKTAPATGSQHVENHASGTITIYNAFTTTPQRLITNTRFQTAGGLVFRIHAPVVVPGYTMKAGVKSPGTVDAVAYADQAGENYNVPAGDFTLPGLTETKQHQLIYAKSLAAMTGGFIGDQAVVDPTVRSQTVDGLKADLERSLRAKLASATVAGSVVFTDTVAIAYTENSDTLSGNTATISVSGTATAPAFDDNALAHQFASVSDISYGGPLMIKNPQDLTAHIDSPIAVGTDTPISVSISGNATLESVFDEQALIADIVGKSKNAIQSVLPKYAGISAIDVKIYPFWLSGLPGNPAKVTVTTVDSAPTATP